MSAKEWLDAINNAKEVSEVSKVYGDAAEQYDTFVKELELCDKKEQFVEFCGSLLKSSDYILDVGAGTGDLAKRLRNFGCKNIDGIEPVKEFGEILKQRNLYSKIYCEFISHKSPCSIESNTYDAVICSGVVFPGHLESEDLDELLRVVKVGGLMMFYYTSKWECYAEFANDANMKFTKAMNEKLAHLVSIKKIKLIKEEVVDSPNVNLMSRFVAFTKES